MYEVSLQSYLHIPVDVTVKKGWRHQPAAVVCPWPPGEAGWGWDWGGPSPGTQPSAPTACTPPSLAAADESRSTFSPCRRREPGEKKRKFSSSIWGGSGYFTSSTYSTSGLIWSVTVWPSGQKQFWPAALGEWDQDGQLVMGMFSKTGRDKEQRENRDVCGWSCIFF